MNRRIYSPDFTKSYTEAEAKKLIKAGTHQFHKPSYQGSSEEEEQVGIKHA